MLPAKVQQCKLKMWAKYPARTGDNDEVQGIAWKVQVQEHAKRLAKYETRAYEIAACKVVFTDDGEGDVLS